MGPGLGPVFTFSRHSLLNIILYKEAFVWAPDVQVTSCDILSASQLSHPWSEVLQEKSGRIYFDLTSIYFALHRLPSWFVLVFESSVAGEILYCSYQCKSRRQGIHSELTFGNYLQTYLGQTVVIQEISKPCVGTCSGRTSAVKHFSCYQCLTDGRALPKLMIVIYELCNVSEQPTAKLLQHNRRMVSVGRDF